MSSLTSSNGMNVQTGVTSINRTVTPAVGDVVIALYGLGSNTVSNFGVSGGGLTWQRAVAKAGSNPPNRKVEIWWAIADAASTITVTGSWTESLNVSAQVAAFTVSGSGDIEAALTGSNEETSTNASHTATATPLDLIADDVAVTVGVTESSMGTYGAGTGWTVLSTTGTFCGTTYRLPTGNVDDNTGPWTTSTARTACSAMAVFRRTTPPPPPEDLFQYPSIRSRGFNHGIN